MSLPGIVRAWVSRRRSPATPRRDGLRQSSAPRPDRSGDRRRAGASASARQRCAALVGTAHQAVEQATTRATAKRDAVRREPHDRSPPVPLRLDGEPIGVDRTPPPGVCEHRCDPRWTPRCLGARHASDRTGPASAYCRTADDGACVRVLTAVVPSDATPSETRRPRGRQRAVRPRKSTTSSAPRYAAIAPSP